VLRIEQVDSDAHFTSSSPPDDPAAAHLLARGGMIRRPPMYQRCTTPSVNSAEQRVKAGT
jgi:hypothetical protein